MEKRIVLSFVLSFVVLILWQKMFPPPKQQQALIGSQLIENKQVIEKVSQKSTSEPQLVAQKVRKPETQANLSNDKINVGFSTHGGAATGANILAYNATLPVREIFELKNFQGLEYDIEKESTDEIVFRARHENLEIYKTYQLVDDDFTINANIQIKNVGSEAISINPAIQTMLVDVEQEGEKLKSSRDRNLMEYSVFSQEKVVRKTGAFKFTAKDKKQVYAPVDWFGFRNRYYCTIIKPEFTVQGYEFLPQEGESQLKINALMNDKELGAGESMSLSSVIYIGPQNSSILKQYELGFEKIQVYFRLAFFDSVAKIIEDLIKFMYKVTHNWGLSILLVSMLIYLAMYPMTMKSMLSMRKMQSLQPKIVELREKHEKNPQKLNQEIMKVYAENKVNPVGGCLPLLLQMPVFICLYQMIWRSVLFKGAGFLWIKDLSEPDRLATLSKSFPVIGNEINLLPVIILILMVVQQRMTAKNMNSTDPNQIAQQKMMAFMMPVVLLLVFYRIASGLTLYLTVFYVLSSFTQWRIAKKVEAEA